MAVWTGYQEPTPTPSETGTRPTRTVRPQTQPVSTGYATDSGDSSGGAGAAPVPVGGAAASPTTPTGQISPSYQSYALSRALDGEGGRAGEWESVREERRAARQEAAAAAAADNTGTPAETASPPAYDQATLWAHLQKYPFTPAGLKQAYEANPGLFGGAVIYGSKGDKLRFPDGRVIDLIANAGMGGTGWQWLDESAGGGGGGLKAPAPGDISKLPGMPDEFWNYDAYLKSLPEYNAPNLLGADQANLQALMAALANPQWSDERASGMKEVQKEQAISMEEQARQQAQQLAASQGRAYGAGTDRRIEDASLAQILGAYRDVNEQVANNRTAELLGLSSALDTSMTGMTDRAQSNYAAEMERFRQALEMALAEGNQRMSWAELMERAREFYDRLGYDYATFNVDQVM